MLFIIKRNVHATNFFHHHNLKCSFFMMESDEVEGRSELFQRVKKMEENLDTLRAKIDFLCRNMYSGR
jgi:hypothetical protein